VKSRRQFCTYALATAVGLVAGSRTGLGQTAVSPQAGNGRTNSIPVILDTDIGSGSMANLAALMIPYEYLDKVFLTHLHSDHMGDLDGLWAGGWTAGRPNALRVWGPSGMTPELGPSTRWTIS